MVEKEFQRLCKENNVEQLLQEELKAEQEENMPDMSDFDRNMPHFPNDGRKIIYTN